MANGPLDISDVPLLYSFTVVAEESNLHRAAERLFMSQPPLSRRIKRLEERLGLTLFIRHTKGLTLTEDGVRVLEAVRPLLKLQAQTFRLLQDLAKPSAKVFALGFTTAFEQGVFTGVENRLRGHYGKRLRIVRESSPKLVRGIRKGRLDASLVALPLDAPGLVVTPLPYDEPLMAVLPEGLPEAKSESAPLRVFNGTPLFWFRRESNPAFSITRGVFLSIRVFIPYFWKSRRSTTYCWPVSPPARAWGCCPLPLRLSDVRGSFSSRYRRETCCGFAWESRPLLGTPRASTNTSRSLVKRFHRHCESAREHPRCCVGIFDRFV